jgi:Fe2+ transport system protein FeoA
MRFSLISSSGPDAVDTRISLPLDMVAAGSWADVTDVAGEPAWVGRMAELGIRCGSRLRVLNPGCPALIEIGSARVCVRAGECCQIFVRPVAGE